MTDEFSSGLRGRRKQVANQARPKLKGADYKPEALTRPNTGDLRLDNELAKIQRALEVVQGTRGQQDDQGVTFRDLEQQLKGFTAEIQNGFLESGTALDTSQTADGVANTALADAAVAQATADQALSDANEAHSGEVTSAAGSRALTVDVSAVSNRTEVTAESGDHVIIRDDTDGTIKKVDVDSIVDGGFF